MLAIVVHEKMKLGDNTVNNHKLSLVNTKLLTKYQRIYRFRLNLTNIKAAIGGKSSHERFWKNSSQCRDILLQVKQVIASFRCYENSDVIATLIITNYHLYLIKLRWPFLQIFVYGDVVYAQTWEVLTLKTVSNHLNGLFYHVMVLLKTVSPNEVLFRCIQANMYA